ncbi:E3 ubiquitin-protein ligase UPL6-like isoform X1 [Gossypium australe]|uniref:HECT-type E3 ubiquitin transferase n=1 Tax=Gossypium australe TaxID=47621 RepID=A0A5B6WHE4_9ROSI|nr:E3 ubiquitin-protein ligase UPL6-like isoform X1 [Gossypium australe]
MFFTGDPTSRKRVDLGGRSSKERDRQKLLEQTRLERNRRLWLRRQNSAALTIQICWVWERTGYIGYVALLYYYAQKYFRGRKVVEAEHAKVREHFYQTYGKHCQNVDRHCFGPDSEFLRQLNFFFDTHNLNDFSVLVETCRLIQNFVRDSGDTVGLFAGMDYSPNHSLVAYRLKRLSFACIQAIHQNRNQLKDQLLMAPEEATASTTILLQTLLLFLDPKLPWACKAVGYLMQRNVFSLFREVILTAKLNFVVKENISAGGSFGKISTLERVLALMISHVGQSTCVCSNAFASWRLTLHYTNKMVLSVQNHANLLPTDISNKFPGYACLLGNILETAGAALSQPRCSFEMAMDLAAVTTFLLDALPPIKSSSRESPTVAEDDMIIGDEIEEIVLDSNLEQQITNAIDSRFLLQLGSKFDSSEQTNVLFGGVSTACDPHNEGPDDKEVAAVTAACAFLHVIFNTLPLERIMTVLAYRTELVPVLWNFIKRCHHNQKWSPLPERFSYLLGDAPGWLLPLAVFCPVYKHMLMIVDNEEFYEQEKPLSLKDVRCLIVILRQALWQLLWVIPSVHPTCGKSISNTSAHKRQLVETIQNRVGTVVSELLSQLQDWNNRRQFTPPSDFHADGVNDFFISQAAVEGSKAHDILKQAPFLIPFTSRVKIFTSQLASVRQRHGAHGVFTRNRFRIRRDHILEDAYNQMSQLSEEDLRGLFGVEEAGIDGGGIFKDFMENITRAAFDVQYGLFKEESWNPNRLETADHLLYPNPGSGMIHEQHLQFFHFLGTLLAKAMFEGILVDIPFATFFLSKLKQKYNYLNDLPSLDPELYRHLIFLKHYKGDISELELYFVIVNNEYGEQTEEELLPGGKNIRVTNENVITFIHLVSNHRLNFQIRQQSSHFLRGFQQLMQKDWIDMFNEHELQFLVEICSLDSLDVDDLRCHTNYAGGYHGEHFVIDMFWEVLKSFSLENQKKFLKAAGGASEEALDRLPTSATCMNLLKLPPYGSKEQLEAKLMYAINADAVILKITRAVQQQGSSKLPEKLELELDLKLAVQNLAGAESNIVIEACGFRIISL